MRVQRFLLLGLTSPASFLPTEVGASALNHFAMLVVLAALHACESIAAAVG